MYEIENMRVVVTGAGSGIGLQIARIMHEAGANVLVSDVHDGALESVRAEGLEGLVCDVSQEAHVHGLMQEAERTLGGLDVLVNNAGIGGPTAPVEQWTSDEWRKVFDVNIHGQFYCVKHGVPLLRAAGGGSIINMSSAAGRLGMAGRSAYSASKWAVIGFTKTLAIELGPDNIRANAICPGAVDGPRIESVIEAKAEFLGRPAEEVAALYREQSSMGRLITSKDVAATALFLASSASNMISGQALAVDGNTEKLY
jgi:NAD(P)-dependent dehydrogenase (short-subunit alcohol dehydrogenase family)